MIWRFIFRLEVGKYKNKEQGKKNKNNKRRETRRQQEDKFPDVPQGPA